MVTALFHRVSQEPGSVNPQAMRAGRKPKFGVTAGKLTAPQTNNILS